MRINHIGWGRLIGKACGLDMRLICFGMLVRTSPVSAPRRLIVCVLRSH